jgi:hypothetical protein
MHDLDKTRVLLKHLKKELNGKLKCSAETEQELDSLIAEIEKAHSEDVSRARTGLLRKRCLAVLGVLIRFYPEIGKFFE